MNGALTWDDLEPLCGSFRYSSEPVVIRKNKEQRTLPALTGIAALDECVGGLRAGDLIEIQGSAFIKTEKQFLSLSLIGELANTIALKVAQQQTSALMATTSCKGHFEAVVKGITPDTLKIVTQESESWDSRRQATPQKMLLWIWTMSAKFQCDRYRYIDRFTQVVSSYRPRVLLIDDAQAMIIWARREARQKTACILRQLKAFAVKNNLTVITLVNPESERCFSDNDTEVIPKFYGVAENEADVVLRVERIDEIANNEMLAEKTVKIRVTALQKGVEKEVRLSYIKACRRFEPEE